MTTLLKRRILVHRLRAWLRLFFLGLLFLDALWRWLPCARQTGQPRTFVFAGLSMLGEMMNEAIFPAFQELVAGPDRGARGVYQRLCQFRYRHQSDQAALRQQLFIPSPSAIPAE